MSIKAYSGYQEGIFSFGEHGTGHAVVEAKAGSGKTSTLVELARRLTKAFPGANIIFLAFNKHIAEELGTRLDGTNASARTIHSVGNQAVSQIAKGCKIETRKYNKIAEQWVDRNASKFAPDERSEIASVLVKLANFARLTLVDVKSMEALDDMCLHFDIEVNYPALMFPAISAILEEGKNQASTHRLIDFTDMIWLPVSRNLTLPKYDFILIDEGQDLNACQLELVMKMCKPETRMFFVADRKQAIMGFSGSDNLSVDKIIARTKATTLPLSICYRCPESHIRLAQMVVPSIQPRPDAPEGEVIFAHGEEDLQKMVQTGDLVICRQTAPLVKECIRLIKSRVAAKVRGRDIGKDLVSLLKKVAKMEGFTYGQVVAFLEEYREKQEEFLRQKDADESIIESLNDRVSCLQVCAESYLNAKSVDDLAKEIESLFDDNRPAVWLSTVHRAKGLEADRVFILKPEKLPLRWKNQQAWQYSQEMNLLYVALTRAKKTLVFLGGLPDPCQREEDVQPELEALDAAQDAIQEEMDFATLVRMEEAMPEGFSIIADPMANGWNTCYQCQSPLESDVERENGACAFCMGWTQENAPATPQQALVALATAPSFPVAAVVELDAAINTLMALVHDKNAMYFQDKIREASEEVARLWAASKQPPTEKEKVQEEMSDLLEPWVCPVCGETGKGACPQHGSAARAHELDAWGHNEFDNSTDPLTERPLPAVTHEDHEAEIDALIQEMREEEQAAAYVPEHDSEERPFGMRRGEGHR